MVIILAVFYKIAKTVFAINLCGLSCFSLWFELTMCLCSLNQALSFGETKIKKAYLVFSEGYCDQNVGNTKEFTVY